MTIEDATWINHNKCNKNIPSILEGIIYERFAGEVGFQVYGGEIEWSIRLINLKLFDQIGQSFLELVRVANINRTFLIVRSAISEYQLGVCNKRVRGLILTRLKHVFHSAEILKREAKKDVSGKRSAKWRLGRKITYPWVA